MSTYYRDNLSAWGEAADGEVDRLSGVIAAQEAELVAQQNENAFLSSEVDRLQAIVDSYQPPAPAKTPTAWGSSTGKHTYAYFTQMAGSPLKARRSYQQLYQAPPAEDFGRCISIASVANNPSASWTDVKPKLLSYLRAVPVSHDMRFIKSHEPENPDKNYSPAAYVAEQKRIRDEVIDVVNAERKAAGGVPIRFGGNWMAWSLQPAAKRNMELWWPGDGVWDFLAADGYAGPEGGRSPATVFDLFVDFCKAKNIRFAIAECGIDVSRPVAERVAWIDACQLYTKNLDPEFWCYWDGSFSTFWLNTVEEFKAVVNHP